MCIRDRIKDPNLIFPGQKVNLGSVGGASAGFPTTSSYQATGSGAAQAETAAKTRLSGWGGPGNVPSDPIKGIMEAAAKPETDPLKINSDKPHSA